MAHAEYRRIVPGADTAVLFIHGIIGTPDHFRILIPLEQRISDGWSVCNLLLPGHGAGVEEFAASSMDAWRGYVRSVFEELATHHERVIIVAHSMGTLFGIQLAVDFPEKVPLLFLLGVPLRPFVRPHMMLDSLRMVFVTLPQEHVLWKAGSVKLTRKLWKYLSWVPRYLELFGEIRRTEKLLDRLSVSCIAWQSGKDELVGNASGRILERSGMMEVRTLPNSTHFYYTPQDQNLICREFDAKIKKLSHN